MSRRRLDAELVRRELASSRTKAQELVAAGSVTVNGAPARKSASQVAASDAIHVKEQTDSGQYVSRGAQKLLGALQDFSGILPSVQGAHCLDAGASTGGFTDVLLQKGAASVLAVDVGYGQLAWKLRQDPKVTVLERTNIRYLDPETVEEEINLVVGDLSFISLTKVLPALIAAAPKALFILLVKPQFEAGKGNVGAGGVVTDPNVRSASVLKVAEEAQRLGLQVLGVTASPLPGPAGNVEYFLALAATQRDPEGATLSGDALVAAVKSAVNSGPQ